MNEWIYNVFTVPINWYSITGSPRFNFMRSVKQHSAWAEVLASVDTRCSLTCQNTKPHSCIGWGPRSFRAAAAGGGQGPSVRRPCNNKVTTWDAYSTELFVSRLYSIGTESESVVSRALAQTSMTFHIPVSTVGGHLTLRTYGADRTKSHLTLLFSHAELQITSFFVCSERALYIFTSTLDHEVQDHVTSYSATNILLALTSSPPLRVEAHVQILLRSDSDHRITVAFECPRWWHDTSFLSPSWFLPISRV